MTAPPPAFDLQSHSTFSDGSLPPRAVVAAAARAGVQVLALTDHDTVDGIGEALTAAAEHEIRVVPAIELSAVDELGEDLHVLGYGIDHGDARLAARLHRYRADRAARIDRMAGALREQGIALDEAELERRRAAGLPLGRPHLAAAADAADPSGFIAAHLVPGRPAYRRRTTPTVAEAIEAIHDAGGVAVWAHPFWDLSDPRAVLTALGRFAGAGLDGVEAFYATHDREQTRLLVRAAAEAGLLTTGSADFHGPEHRLFSRFRAFDLHGCEPALGPIGQAAAGGE